jgi:hypothetical protein
MLSGLQPVSNYFAKSDSYRKIFGNILTLHWFYLCRFAARCADREAGERFEESSTEFFPTNPRFQPNRGTIRQIDGGDGRRKSRPLRTLRYRPWIDDVGIVGPRDSGSWENIDVVDEEFGQRRVGQAQAISRQCVAPGNYRFHRPIHWL